MVYAARISGLGPGDFVKLECMGCGLTELVPNLGLTLGLRLPPETKILDVEPRLRCRESPSGLSVWRDRCASAATYGDRVGMTKKLTLRDFRAEASWSRTSSQSVKAQTFPPSDLAKPGVWARHYANARRCLHPGI
jgi:hypothetical protein